MKNFLAFIVLFCLVFITSCNFDGVESEEWEPIVAFPLVKGNLSMDDLISLIEEDQLIDVGDDNLINLKYSSTAFSNDAENALLIEPIEDSFETQVGISFPTIPVGFNQAVNLTETFDFMFGIDVRIDSAAIKSGILAFNLSTDIRHDLVLTMTLPQLTKDGAFLTFSLDLPYGGTVPTTGDIEIPLNDHLLDFTGNADGSNNIDVLINMSLTGTGNPLEADESISADMSLKEMKFKRAFGELKFGDFLPQFDTIDISVFDEIESYGTFTVKNPSVDFDIQSSIGVALKAYFSVLEGLNTVNGDTIDFAANADIPNPFDMPFPLITEYGSVKTNSFTLDGPSIKSLFNERPKTFVYGIQASTDPNFDEQSFLIDTAKYSIKATVNLPLEGTAELYELQDTFDLGAIDPLTGMKDVNLRLVLDNGIPIDGTLQAILLDANDMEMDRLFDDPGTSIISAEVDSDGLVTNATENIIDIPLSQELQDNLSDAKRIVMQVSAITAGGGTQNVSFYSDYKIEYKIGLKATLVNPL